ncbi:MAG: protein kinase [Mariprofundaceae bacterium]|nr:protein kinase [Mariprofundaceae bacterium]
MIARQWYKKGWFHASTLGSLFIVAHLLHFSPLQRLEGGLYDSLTGIVPHSVSAPGRVAVIVTDNAAKPSSGNHSVPWTRKQLARLLNNLGKVTPAAIGVFNVPVQPETSPALGHLEGMKNYILKSDLPKKNRKEAANLIGMINYARRDLDEDTQLEEAIRNSRGLYLGMTLGPPSSTRTLPDWILQHALVAGVEEGVFDRYRQYIPLMNNQVSVSRIVPDNVLIPPQEFASVAAGTGITDVTADRDGVVRAMALLVKNKQSSGDVYLPSLPLLISARIHGIAFSKLSVLPHKAVQEGHKRIRLDSAMRYYPAFYPANKFSVYQANDVLAGKVPLKRFRHKAIVIGSSRSVRMEAPDGAHISPLLVQANVLASLLERDYFYRPVAAAWIELILLLVIVFYLAVILPRIRLAWGVFLSFLVLLALFGGETLLLYGRHAWIMTGTASLLLIAGQLMQAVRHSYDVIHQQYLMENAQTNRQLGVALQEQGRLELALERFRLLPKNHEALGFVYNLGLEFERKRKFDKALESYHYILEYEHAFRDVQARKIRLEQLSTFSSGAISATTSLIMPDIDNKPTLGRYVIERELGKGAMGIVYQGRDPTIDREVAIKTMALSQEFQDDELVEARERFFREAAAAGKLNHPNIITIHDVGEEHDLAYIAMEFIKGESLNSYAREGTLLPVKEVLHIVSVAADALDYAHKEGVVHRDIKPANIIYDRKKNSLKIADFGIARITASSHTQTGVILGTPAYMSPEQMTGHKVDGRSDLFSLGTTMFVLLTGKAPFPGDTLAALSYQISHDKHPNICKVRPELPACIRSVMDKVLAKDSDKRYQNGAAFKRAVNRCLKVIED